MYKFALGLIFALVCSSAAEATCTPPSNGTTADASALNTYLNCEFAPLVSPLFTGNVGIGTTSPNALLSLGTNIQTIKIAAYDASAGNNFFGMGVNSGKLAFGAGLSTTTGTPQMVLTNAGNLGIGTTTPATTLQVVGDLTFGNGTANTFSNIHTATADGADTDGLLLAGGGASNDSTRGAFINLYGNDFSYLGIYGGVIISAGQATSGSGGNIALNTDSGSGSVTRLTIANAGNVGIGTTTPAVALAVVGDIRVGTSGTNGCVQGFGGAALTGTCSSDARLKNVVGNVSGVLDKLSNLQLVTFHWNDKAHAAYHNSTTTLNTGFLAQAVEQQFPELVSMDRLGYRQVNYSTLSLYSIEAIKELKALNDSQAVQIKNQSAEIAVLTSRLSDEDRRLSRLETGAGVAHANLDDRSTKLRRLSAANIGGRSP